MSNSSDVRAWENYVKLYLNLCGEYNDAVTTIKLCLPNSDFRGERAISFGELLLEVVRLNKFAEMDEPDFLEWGYIAEIRKSEDMPRKSFVLNISIIVSLLRRAGLNVIVASDNEIEKMNKVPRAEISKLFHEDW